MLGRLRLGLAIGSALLLLSQGTVAAASALACMKACEQAKAERSQGASCHGKQRAGPGCESKRECDGACSYICSPEKATATPTVSATAQVPKADVPAFLPRASEHQVTAPVSEPELFQTDSSLPARAPESAHRLRAPPVLSA